jgi:ATP-dependent exoDNAse (exonuclease V) beta subunit
MIAAHPDSAAHRRVADSFDETLFVEAGAGSGKTRTLVTRLVNLVIEADVPVGAIAAITFTEKAAAELRERVRRAFELEATGAGSGDRTAAARPRAQLALDDLDGAAIGTLHSFAQRILVEHAVEAGLPPRIEVLDEVASMVAFDERWSAFVDEVLDDARLARSILILTSAGVRLDELRDVAVAFNQNWDLVAARVPAEPSEPPEWQADVDKILQRVQSVCDARRYCDDSDDHLRNLLDNLEHWSEQLRAAPDESARVSLLRPEGGRPNASPNGKGRRANWDAGCDLNGLRDEIASIQERCEDLANEVGYAALSQLGAELQRFTLAAAEERRREGTLEFHDLLVMARHLLRHPVHGPAARESLAQRYQRLLIDEFQDTDPIQVELAVLIAASAPDGVGDTQWDHIATTPGALFFVGDPKQSIYRFRRADITLFLRAADLFGADGRRLTLLANHRSGHALVRWTNDVFGELMAAPDDDPCDGAAASGQEAEDDSRSQPRYQPAVARRSDAPVGSAVAVVGRHAHLDRPSADELRAREAQDVAAAARTVLEEAWLVDRCRDDGESDWHPARAGDITILVPTRLSLPFLEDALTDVGLPYRTESSSLVYGSRLVRDLFLALHAIDDPTDELSIVAALRSAPFGCGDDDLFGFRVVHGGRFDYTRRQPDTVPEDHPVAIGLEYLGRLHEQRRWATPSEMLDQVVRERHVLELSGAAGRSSSIGRARDLWHRIRFITDQARAWTDATGGTLRQYLEWVRHQSAPAARVTEAVLPETDDDAVRIMTIHAAKGLEFPICIVAGLSTQPQTRRAGAQVLWRADEAPIITIGRRVTSPAFDAQRPLDEQMSHDERIRLLYVACTRARDHLVVSLHRRQRAKPVTHAPRLTSAELLTETMGDAVQHLPDVLAAGVDEVAAHDHSTAAGPAEQPSSIPDFATWQRERAAALLTSGRPRTIAATALTDEGQPDGAAEPADPGLQKRPRDLDLPPWRKGRYGTAIGRAVHGVLQLIDLATGHGLDAAVAAQAMAEGVVGQEARVRALVQSALAAPTVAEAASRPHWREVHVAVPIAGDRMLEGYVDLLYRDDQGLVVVDYKTGPDAVGEDLAPLIDRYRLQGASYALAVADATGEAVRAMTFVFLTPNGAFEHTLSDLAASVANARRLLAQ